MLEIAIISLKCALRDDYPEFKEFYELREWEPKKSETEDAAAEFSEEEAEPVAPADAISSDENAVCEASDIPTESEDKNENDAS